jgi:hypothetical protein
VAGGDEATFSPAKTQHSLLAAERASQKTRRLETDGTNNLYVNIAADSTGGTGYANTVNSYSETLVPFATVTTVLTYVVPLAQTLNILEVIGWGDTSGEFLIKVNGITKGGGRSTAANPNFVGTYQSAPIVATAGDTVTVTAEHYNPSPKTMKINLMGGIS